MWCVIECLILTRYQCLTHVGRYVSLCLLVPIVYFVSDDFQTPNNKQTYLRRLLPAMFYVVCLIVRTSQVIFYDLSAQEAEELNSRHLSFCNLLLQYSVYNYFRQSYQNIHSRQIDTNWLCLSFFAKKH